MDPAIKNFLLGLLGGVVIATVGFLYSRWGKHKDSITDAEQRTLEKAKEDVEREKEKVRVLQGEVKELRMLQEAQHKAAIPITAAMEAMLIARLTNDHSPEADALLKKQTDGTLTADDAVKFAQLMKERETDKDPRIGRAQQIAAEMLPLTIELKKLDEIAAAEGPCEVKTLMVTVPETETKRAQDGGTQEEEKGN